MRIETQTSSDESIIHFYPESKFDVKNGSEYRDAKSSRKLPLADNIFDLGNVEAVLITSDCISVTKSDDGDWNTLKPQILAEIMDFLSLSGKRIFSKEESLSAEELERKVAGLLSARVRPAIQKDGGDIVLRKIEDGIVYVELQGKCVGCPYAQRTLKDSVEKIICRYIPEIRAVEKYEG